MSVRNDLTLNRFPGSGLRLFQHFQEASLNPSRCMKPKLSSSRPGAWASRIIAASMARARSDMGSTKCPVPCHLWPGPSPPRVFPGSAPSRESFGTPVSKRLSRGIEENTELLLLASRGGRRHDFSQAGNPDASNFFVHRSTTASLHLTLAYSI